MFGALGIAIISKRNSIGVIPFDFNLKDIEFNVTATECTGCSNNCELVSIYKDNALIDTIGSRCGKIHKQQEKEVV